MRLVIVLDSVGYRTFLRADTELGGLGEVHLAYSHGSWTLPSIASMLVGIFPACSVPGCKHRSLIRPDPLLPRRANAVVYTSNPWVELLAPGLGARVVRVRRTADAIRRLGAARGSDLVFVHVMETHFRGGEPWSEEIQIERLESVDGALMEIIGRLAPEELVVTADHGENFGPGERHGNFDGVFRRGIFEVPLLTVGV